MAYETLHVLEVIDTNNTGVLRECIICHCWYFLRISFKFLPKVWSGCHDTTQKSPSFNNVMIVTVGRNDHSIHFWSITKVQAVNRMKLFDLSEERWTTLKKKMDYYSDGKWFSRNLEQTQTAQWKKGKETEKIYTVLSR